MIDDDVTIALVIKEEQQAKSTELRKALRYAYKIIYVNSIFLADLFSL